MASESTATERLTVEAFVGAWEAGAFDDRRVELIDGEVVPVVIGEWHGTTTGRITRKLPEDDYVVTMTSLPAPRSFTDPDVWVRPAAAQPVRHVSRRLRAWAPADVLLVVEVGDETMGTDLRVKARLYAQAEYPVYWVATPEGIYEHTEPGATGYAARRLYAPAESIPVRYADIQLPVADLLAPE